MSLLATEEGHLEQLEGGTEVTAVPSQSAFPDHPCHLAQDLCARECHPCTVGPTISQQEDNSVSPQLLVVLQFDDTYLRTLPGVLRFLQVVFSLIALICVASCGTDRSSYLLLPLSWHLRIFIFVSVLGFLISLLVLFGHVTQLILMLPLQWDIFDTVVYGLLCFHFLFGSSLVASALDFYQKLDGHVERWTIKQLIVAVVLGYVCVFLYGATAVLAYREWRGLEQFHRRRFSTNSTRGSGNKPTEPNSSERPSVV